MGPADAWLTRWVDGGHRWVPSSRKTPVGHTTVTSGARSTACAASQSLLPFGSTVRAPLGGPAGRRARPPCSDLRPVGVLRMLRAGGAGRSAPAARRVDPPPCSKQGVKAAPDSRRSHRHRSCDHNGTGGPAAPTRAFKRDDWTSVSATSPWTSGSVDAHAASIRRRRSAPEHSSAGQSRPPPAVYPSL